MTRKRGAYVADFETTTDKDDCRVWGYGLMSVDNHDVFSIGSDLDEFMEYCEQLKTDIYFHNLRFDGSFIVNWLYRNGFSYSDIPYPNTFNTMISKMNQWYSIQVVYDTNKSGRPIHTTFFDSLKKLPFSVDMIAKTYNLDTLKGSIDYTKYRPVDHVITDEEYDYIYTDVHIMAQALKLQIEKGLKGITIGSDALKDFKKIVGRKLFDFNYPVLDKVIDDDIRKAYKGGFTWLNKKYQEKEINGGLVYDVNSLYPFIMYSRNLPYGKPIFFKGEYVQDDEYPLYIQHVKCVFNIKPNKIPTIQIKQNLMFGENEYLESSKGQEVDLYVTNVDLDLIKEHYDLEYIVYMSGYKFKQKQGIFKDYIDKWSKEKIEKSGGEKLLAKLMLNNLYGKFATNPDVTGKIPVLDDEGKINMELGESEERDPVYTPLGVFITSYAREYTIRTAQQLQHRIIYCDTDSIHLTGTDVPYEIEHLIDPDKLGYWAFEGQYKKGKYLRQKTYMHMDMTDDKGNTFNDVKCAGMPDNIKEKVTFDNFKVGFSSYGKLLPTQVSGGVVLIDTEFTIR